MAFNTFVDRVVQYPGRVIMTPVAGEANTYDMSRAEGDVATEGTRFNAQTFNGIADEIIQTADDNIITQAQLNQIKARVGVGGGLYDVLYALGGSYIDNEVSADDVWTYRKWENGTVEAWASLSLGSQTGNVWVSPIRYVDLTVDIPSGIFTEAPKAFGVSRSNQWWVNSINASSATRINTRILTLAATAQNAGLNIYAVERHI